MSLRAEMMQIMADLFVNSPSWRNGIAHFCSHDGIRIRFTRARTTWMALTPSGIKPWCLKLEPLRMRTNSNDNRMPDNIDNEATENA